VGSDPEGNGTLSIWRTADRGVDWIPARVVPTDPSINGYELVVDLSDPSIAALAWQPRGSGGGDSYTGGMTSVDGGATWQVHAMPSLPTSPGSSAVSSLLAITSDGSLLATGLGILYRLDASSGRWQSLGPLPEPGVIYCPAPGDGMLWAVPFSGGTGDPQQRIFTASYTP
jgi:hypothetical protein